MVDFPCAFNGPLVADQFCCALAMPVTRRGGPDMACTDEAAHQRCKAVLAGLKHAALPAFGVEDDPLTMPHSVLVKIQYAGLLALQKESKGTAGLERTVDNIDAMLAKAIATHGAVDALPYARITGDITSFKLKRGRR